MQKLVPIKKNADSFDQSVIFSVELNISVVIKTLMMKLTKKVIVTWQNMTHLCSTLV